ncbi:MAG: D-alanyl-D-alanine endopeptidase [Zoogloeaceae bacterium]|nr:D-alanyl-D-alanine endopeptidase [Zoogloeaceae bacterium]
MKNRLFSAFCGTLVLSAYFLMSGGWTSAIAAEASEKHPVRAKKQGQKQKPTRKLAQKRSPVSKSASAPQELFVNGQMTLRSTSALVLDQSNGQALLEKNAAMIVPIASITKLMTAMVVLDAHQPLEELIQITEEDVDYLRGSGSRVRPGLSMTRDTALLLALMSSENRAANALGRHYPGGIPAFVAAMNQKARALGLRQTHFSEPTGLSARNVSTARDLARMVEAAHQYPKIREYSTMTGVRLDTGTRILSFTNTNALVKNPQWQIGLSKTGYISEAGRCLVMQAWVAGRPVVMVLLDAQGKMTRVGDANRIKRWIEANPSRLSAAVGA